MRLQADQILALGPLQTRCYSYTVFSLHEGIGVTTRVAADFPASGKRGSVSRLSLSRICQSSDLAAHSPWRVDLRGEFIWRPMRSTLSVYPKIRSETAFAQKRNPAPRGAPLSISKSHRIRGTFGGAALRTAQISLWSRSASGATAVSPGYY